MTKIVFEGECVGKMVRLHLNLAREETRPPALSAVYLGALKGAQAFKVRGRDIYTNQTCMDR